MSALRALTHATLLGSTGLLTLHTALQGGREGGWSRDQGAVIPE